GGIFTGSIYSRFTDSDLQRCSGLPEGPFRRAITLSISRAGTTLQGENRTLEVESCEKRERVEHLTLRRLPGDGTDSSGYKRVRATREEVLAAARLFESRRARRFQLAGLWKNANT